MRRAQGYAVWTDPSLDQITRERDTFTCAHCNKIVIVEPKADPASLGGFCRLCMKNVCGPCADQGKCEPFEKKLEKMEARARMFKSIGV